MDDSLVSRYNNYLAPFKQQSEEFKKAKKRTVYNNAKKLHIKLLSIYYDDYNYSTDEEKERMCEKYNPKSLHLKGQRFIEEKSKSHPEEIIAEEVKLRRQKADDDSDEFIDIPDMSPLEGDEEEVKEGKGLKILTLNKMLTRLPIVLAQIKAGNNSSKLKNEIRQILYLLYQHNKITKKIYNNLIKLI